MAQYRERLIDPLLADLMTQLPAMAITGSRATGKTTTGRRHAATTVRLDRPAEASAFVADPDLALRDLPEPVLLDEWQEVPGVLAAVKRAVDDDPRPGRFLLTGSARVDLDQETWPGTGRVVRIRMYGLSSREIAGRVDARSFLDRVLDADVGSLSPGGNEDLGDYLDQALLGGFPEPALRLSGRARRAWLDGYVDQLITRDAQSLDGPRDPERLRRYLEALAVSTAGVVEDKTLYDAAGLNRRTAAAYDHLLENLGVLDALPAWWSNRLTRLTGTPKRFVVDSSLVASVLRLDRPAVLRDGHLLGRIVETFVLAQIRPEVAASPLRPRCFHLRDKGGRHEIDLVVEFGGGRVVAIEVKAGASVDRRDGVHLEWLREELGDRFVAGVVLHSGPRALQLADRVFAAPISTLWKG